MTTAPPASATDALEMLTSAMSYLAAADPALMSTEVQARCLAGLERADAIETAARASVLGAFTAGAWLLRGRGLQPPLLAHPQDQGY